MPERGFLVLSDITGYTEFLSKSELEHAEDILRELMDILIKHTRPPLVISKLEGDAVFSFAPERSFTRGDGLLTIIESLYVTFRDGVHRMRLNTTCTCKACSNIPNLDLKFFVHFGDYIQQKVAGFTELVGTDVNLAHRLMKNHITELHNLKAYALYSQQAIDALEIGTLVETMIPHTESYDHLGEISLYFVDMHALYDRSDKKQRVVITEEESSMISRVDLPCPKEVTWDLMTNPEFRAYITGSTKAAITTEGGRLGKGTVYHCAHGGQKSDHTIVDWQPFDYYTVEEAFPDSFPGPRVYVTGTYLVVDTDSGSQIVRSYSGPQGGNFLTRLMGKLFLGSIDKQVHESNERFKQKAIEAIEKGDVVISEVALPDANMLDNAIKESLPASS